MTILATFVISEGTGLDVRSFLACLVQNLWKMSQNHTKIIILSIQLRFHCCQACQRNCPPPNLDHLSEKCLRFLPPFHQSHICYHWAKNCRFYNLTQLPSLRLAGLIAALHQNHIRFYQKIRKHIWGYDLQNRFSPGTHIWPTLLQEFSSNSSRS